jgi:hypothetical protein
LIGTTLSSAVNPNPTPDVAFTVTVADTSMFWNGARALIGQPSTGEEPLLVQKVVDSTHLLVKGALAGSYAANAFFRLAVAINSVYVQTLDGNTGPIYIGTRDNMVTATGVFCVKKLQPVTAASVPTDWLDTRSSAIDADDSGELWVNGTTTGDKYLPTLGIV